MCESICVIEKLIKAFMIDLLVTSAPTPALSINVYLACVRASESERQFETMIWLRRVHWNENLFENLIKCLDNLHREATSEIPINDL